MQQPELPEGDRSRFKNEAAHGTEQHPSLAFSPSPAYTPYGGGNNGDGGDDNTDKNVYTLRTTEHTAG
ncbi:Hypothetical protein D9617_29g006700 [Elsinoe fawcettii]|nr:Hypothetical protein D9617_29g006700 [Elsinoe fawcettii]